MNLAYKEVILNQIQLLFPSMPVFKCNRDNWEKKNEQYLDCIRVIENLEPVKAIPLDKVKQAREEIDDLYRYYDNDYYSGNIESMFKCSEVFEIIDKLIESEGAND